MVSTFFIRQQTSSYCYHVCSESLQYPWVIYIGWNDTADRRTDSLVYKIVNHDVNVPSEGILIPAKWWTRKCQWHHIFLHIGSNTDCYMYSFYPQTITKWNKLLPTNINATGTATIKDRLTNMPLTRAWLQNQ